MAKNNNVKDFTKDIADAIRAQKGTTDKINPQNFSDEIRALSGGDYNVESVISEDGATQTLIIQHKDYVPPYWNSDFSQNTPDIIARVGNEIAYFGYTAEDVQDIYGWSMGDTVRYVTTDGETIEVRLCDYNHDDLSDESGKAGITLEMTHCLTTYYQIDTFDSTQRGAYPASDMYKTYLPQFKSKMPTEWQNVIKPVKKLCANGGKYSYSQTLEVDSDLFLMSLIEIKGTKDYGPEDNPEGYRYAYYAQNAGNACIKTYGISGSAIPWRTRTPSIYSTSNYVGITADGGYSAGQIPSSREGVSYAFCVGAASDYSPKGSN